ncbi:unnamed protein product [Phaeothamnion confervicola]
MKPSAHGLDDKNVYNMAVVKDNGTFSMIYRGESKAEDKNECTGRLFLATSTDGVHFSRNEAPVFVGSESYESHGVEDPRIVKVGGTFYMTYSGYDGHIARLCLATSTDLRNWDKLGPMFPKFPAGPNGRFSEDWTKSGAILPEKLTSGRFAGEYVMVFGDTDLWLAHSKDMTHWDYLPDPVLRTRPEHHDRALVEPGPPLMLTKQGILLLYNSADEHNHYAMMGALFDAQDPTKLKKRLDLPFLEPTLNWEKTGYVPHVVFGEALIHDGDHWNLYYGGADHQIGLARAPFDPALLP